VKRLVLRDVLAKRGSYPSSFGTVFASEFPTVYQAVQWINSCSSPSDGCGRSSVHAKLIRILQRMESALVIENACPALLESGIPCVPLHDAVFCRASDANRAETIFLDVFRRSGVRLPVKRKTIADVLLQGV
jgi:hypothetical protein